MERISKLLFIRFTQTVKAHLFFMPSGSILFKLFLIVLFIFKLYRTLLISIQIVYRNTFLILTVLIPYTVRFYFTLSVSVYGEAPISIPPISFSCPSLFFLYFFFIHLPSNNVSWTSTVFIFFWMIYIIIFIFLIFVNFISGNDSGRCQKVKQASLSRTAKFFVYLLYIFVNLFL